VNERIRAREVRVIDANGDQLGILSLDDARRAAEQRELDLIEVAPNATPPVCRIMDYGKFRYEQRKKQKDAQKKSKQAEIKMLRCRPNTDDHDIDFKMRNARKFLIKGHKVRFTVIFRGPELRHKEIGENQLRLFIEGCKDIASVENHPRMEGRRMTMQLEPRPDVLLKARAEAEAAAKAGIAPEPEPEDDSAELEALEEEEA
jgi:translation initiation factor IF-3